jgi:PEP-CTERM motif
MNFRIKLAAAAAILTLSGTAAQADVIYSGPSSMAELTTGTSFDVDFNALHAGAADLSFVLDGFASLDGQNWYEDDFTLSLNGLAIAKGTWNLGGGGADVVYLAPLGATFDNISDNGADHLAINWNGGHVNVDTPLDLQAGANTLTFAYDSLSSDGGAHAGWQGTGDEGWAAHDIKVTQTGAVPEPAAWGLMIIGFGGMGAVLRRQRRLQPALARI